MSRLSKGMMLSVVAAMIFGGTAFAILPYYVPSSWYPTIQSALNACKSGDYIEITYSYSDPGFTVNKANILIYGHTGQESIYMTGNSGTVPIQVSNHVSFQNLSFTNQYTNRDLFQINANNENVSFQNCILNQGSTSSARSCIYDKGCAYLSLYNTVLITGNWGIYSSALTLSIQSGSNMLWSNKNIEYSNGSNIQNYPFVNIANSYFTMNTYNNGWCSKTSFPNLANGKYNTVKYDHCNFSAYGSGSVPVILNQHNSANFTYNSFNNCPTGPRWTKTSSDVIAQNSGNTGCY